MAQDLAGVINQLRNNNEEERARDSNLIKTLHNLGEKTQRR